MKTKRNLKYILLLIGMIYYFPTYGQETIEVSGVVIDAESEMPLPGVSIVVQNSNQGTTTDFDGNYSINVDPDETLVFSYVGFETVEIPVMGRTDIDVSLETDQNALEEVVVVGYGTRKKSDLTGAVASADLETFREQGNTSIVQSLQGTVAGLNVGASTEAGEGLNISIRGNNTLGAGANTSPLIVVDGIIYRGSLNDLNPDDVESIDVLKDASSTAIYGSQASNGVVIVTTRSGQGTGKPTFNFSSRYSIREDANRLEYGTGEDYLEQWRAFDWELAYPQSPTYDPNYDPVDRLDPNERLGLENGTNVDWQDLLTQQGFLVNHNLSIAGNSEDITYFVSGSYLDEAGIIRGDDYSKITGRVNLEMKLNNWLKIGTNSFVTTADHSGRELNRSGYTFAPFVAPYDENGNIIVQPTSRGISPLLAANDLDEDKRLHLNSTLYTIIDVPWMEGLSYRMNYNNSYRTRRHNQFLYENVEVPSQGRKDFFLQNDWTLDNIVSYDTEINDVHSINATLVYGREERFIESTEAFGTDFSSELLGFNNLTLADLEFIESAAEDESSIYQMARLNYGYDDKYFVTGTVRRDGFSGFGAENKFAIFPSVALAWTISEENFFENINETVSNFRLRASYGESGKRGLNRYTTLARVAQNDAYIFGDGGGTVPGQEQTSIASPNLKWETTTGINIGLDFGLLKNRITGNIEYYNNDTEDIIVNIQIPSVNGFTNTNVNLGKVHNSGLEFSINSTNVILNDFSWSSMVNFATNENEVVSVLGKDDNEDGIEDDIIETDGAQIGQGQYGFFIGESLGTIYHFQIDPDNPIYQIGDDIPGGYEAGYYRLVDQNGDGTITSADDKVILGKQEPAYRFSILNSFKYKNFGLDVFINSIQGGKNGYLGTDNYWNVSQWDFGGRGQVTGLYPQVIDYWTPANPDSEGPTIRYGGESKPAEAILLRDRSFIRLQNVNLSYTLNPELVERIGINNLTFNVSGNNLVTWTDWKGLDPETNSGISRDRPVLRSYTMGVNFSF